MDRWIRGEQLTTVKLKYIDGDVSFNWENVYIRGVFNKFPDCFCTGI